MTAQTFEAFASDKRALGFDEALVREWAPGQQLATHTHPFDVQALVVRGELALTCKGHTRRVVAGEGFELDRDEPHAEHYGPQGATFWVARRHTR